MSWDVMIFNLKQKVTSVEEIEDKLLVPVNFSTVIEQHFKDVISDDDHREINGDHFSISYFADEEPEGNLLLHLAGENAIYALIDISRAQGWQIFDTGNGQMIDMEHPERNGYTQLEAYRQQVLKS